MYIYRISHLFSIHQWKVGGLKFRPVSEIFSYFYILYLLIYKYFKILSSSMRYFEILFPISIQIFYFIRAKISEESPIYNLFLDEVSDLSISQHVYHSFHMKLYCIWKSYMDQYHAAVLISTRFAEIENFGWCLFLFFSFSVLSNLAEISRCVNMSNSVLWSINSDPTSVKMKWMTYL